MKVTRREMALMPAALAAQTGATPGMGVIGMGNRAKAHMAALAKLNARVVALSDVESAKIDAANAGLASKATAYTDYRELLKDRNVTAVTIATPNFLHHEMAIAALRAGKDVMLEKPIAIDFKQAREIQREAERTGRILAIGMQRAFRSDVELVETVKQGAIGNVRLISAGEYRRDWFPGGWVFRDPVTGKSANWRFMRKAIGSSELEFSVHMYGTLTRIVGAAMVRLTATGGALRYKDRDIRDGSTTIVEYANGVRLSHTYCMFAPQTPHLIVLGDNGSLRRDGGKLTLFDAEGKPKALPAVERPKDEDEVLMYRDFFEAVATRRPPQVGAALAIEAAKIAWGTDISIAENRTVTAKDFA